MILSEPSKHSIGLIIYAKCLFLSWQKVPKIPYRHCSNQFHPTSDQILYNCENLLLPSSLLPTLQLICKIIHNLLKNNLNLFNIQINSSLLTIYHLNKRTRKMFYSKLLLFFLLYKEKKFKEMKN